MKTAVENVNVFDGNVLLGTQRVVFEGDVILDPNADADIVVDGSGCTLLPGLIESHAHLYSQKMQFMDMAVRGGITTFMDMGIRDPENVSAMGLRNMPGKCQIYSSCGMIFAPGSVMGKAMGYPDYMVLESIDDIPRIVDKEIAFGADYIKVIFEDPERNNGVLFPPEMVKALTDYAHSKGKKVVCHAVSNRSFMLAATCGVDIISHLPYMMKVTPEVVKAVADAGCVIVPTVIMGKSLIDEIISKMPPGARQAAMNAPADPDAFDLTIRLGMYALTEFFKGGVTILAGTDSNLEDPLTVAQVPYGTSLHDELEFFVQGGMTPAEALSAATSVPARVWGLDDRGTIAPGKRADLVMVQGDITEDISCIKKISRVWAAGQEISL